MSEIYLDLNHDKDRKRIKGVIESILFVSGDAVLKKEIKEILQIDKNMMESILKELKQEYEDESRGIILLEFNDKVQLSTKPEYSHYIKRMVKSDSRHNLSQAALETLAIIAYKQPITKSEIDEIRGVRSDKALSTLMDYGLIAEAGRLETIGRPIIYETTEEFLKYFGFNNLKELPKLIEFNLEKKEE
ncbi:Segregation and condensation protein B [Caloramator mitchellensis]|uniref:Segregation and condensation protein B n=1 Tax=Caloramator mitchellensis TaxID=908809 RepID=A0A0R3K087_CALMK|nr:SMC-Scp complex subunit ScpB [Caloramator mitchellensis]KRQ86804.1 Segregation and condensation protein B [Caloramator mitchellensis]